MTNQRQHEVSSCKYCQSENVIKYGKYKNTQYYYCKDCKRKFTGIDTIPKMQYPTDQISDVLNMYYEEMSLNEIRRNLIQQDNSYISKDLITVDYDHLNILDVIGEGAQSITGGINSELVEKSYKNVVETHKRLTIAGDTKLASRYGSLRSYLESRLHLWNIQPCI